ncbi:MAG: hypothetical protein ABR570_03470 [Burkholderiales bacterium]
MPRDVPAVPSIKVSWWAEQIGPTEIRSFEGIDDFRRSLDEDYVAVVHPRPGDLGGLYQMAVHFVSSVTLADVAAFIAAGIAYDMLKSGSEAFLLRPFLAAFRRLRERNESFDIGIEELLMEFQNSILAIDGSYRDAIPSQNGFILETIAENYKTFTLESGETPFEIRIPVFEDTAEDRPARFRALLEVDETLAQGMAEDYSGFWGLWYDYSRQYRVFDVKRRLLIDEKFLSRSYYLQIVEQRWRGQRAVRQGN